MSRLPSIRVVHGHVQDQDIMFKPQLNAKSIFTRTSHWTPDSYTLRWTMADTYPRPLRLFFGCFMGVTPVQ